MAVTYLQSISRSDSTIDGSTHTITFTSSVQTGSLLVCYSEFWNASDVMVSDNVNGSWTKIVTQTNGGSFASSCWYFQNSASGTITVSVAPNTTASIAIAIAEYSGVKTTGALNAYNSSFGTASTANPGSISANSGDLIVCGAGGNIFTSVIVNSFSPGTLREQKQPGGFAVPIFYGDHTNASGTETPTFTFSGSIDYCCIGASFFKGAVTAKLFRQSNFDGLGVGGPFFTNPL